MSSTEGWPHEGDILLSWSRGDKHGSFESPFDLWFLEIEERPLGTIVLEGLRNQQETSWTMGPECWDLATRPVFSTHLLPAYLHADHLVRAGDLERARSQWRDVAEEESSHPWLRSWLLYHGAGLLRKAKRWSQAGVLYREAMQAATQLNPRIPIQLLLSIGYTFQQRGDHSTAEEYYQRHLLKSKELGEESLFVASSLACLGSLALADDLQKARTYFSQALAMREKLAPDSFDLANNFIWVGYTYWQQGDLDSAEQSFLKAESIQQKLAKGAGPAESLFYLGGISETRGDLLKAEKYYREALAMEQRLGLSDRRFAQALNGISNVAFLRGEPTKSEYYQRRVLAVERKLNPKSQDVATSLMNLALFAQARGEMQRAQEYAMRSLRLEEELMPGTLELADALTGLGDILLTRGARKRAERYLQRALVIEEKLAPASLFLARTRQELGELYGKAGHLSQADENYSKAIDIAQKVAPGSTYLSEALVGLAGIKRREKQLDEAEKLYQKTVDALENQTARLGGGSDVRSGFRAKHQDPYREYVDLLAQQGKTEAAFAVLERSRARSLAEALATGHVDIKKGVDPTLLDQERSIGQKFTAKTNYRIHLLSASHSEEELHALDKEIAGLLSQYKEIEDQIRSNSPAYAALTQPQSVTAKKVQEQLLDHDTVLLEYSLGKEHSYLFALTSTTLNIYELPNRTKIERTARLVYALLRARNHALRGETRSQRQARLRSTEQNYARAVEVLSQMILGPMTQEIQKKRLLIVSDGALAYIPFGILSSPNVHKSTKRATLLAEHEIVNLPSASVLSLFRQQEQERKGAPKAVAVLADPVFSKDDPRVQRLSLRHEPKENSQSGTDALRGADLFEADLPAHLLQRSLGDVKPSGQLHLSRLPYTRQEAQAIATAVPVDQGMQALDFQASRNTAMSPDLAQYRIVHFATHGLLDSRHPELSGLVLSLVDEHGQGQDGFLQLQDIYNLNLAADLVVLSACETGLGKEVDGEGLVGLTRGFMYAGASRVLASLWRVDDEATAQLMKKFYEGVLKDNKTPAQALREAQLWMQGQRKWRQPYYWAGFILQGEWK